MISGITKRKKSPPSLRRGPVVAVTWDSARLYYAIADVKGNDAIIRSRQAIPLTEDILPLVQLRQHFEQTNHAIERVLLLLPRSSLEMTSVSVPKVEASELTALIHGEVEQLLGDGESELIVDYLQLASTDASPLPTSAAESSTASGAQADSTLRAVACSLRSEQLEQWRQQAEGAKFRLAAIAPRQLAPIPVLQASGMLGAPVTVLLVIYSSEVEVAFYRRSELLFFRTIRTRITDVDSLSDQIQTEVRRTISLANLDIRGEELRVIMHVAEGAEVAEAVAIQEALAAALSAEVRNLATGSAGSDPVFAGALAAWCKQQLPIDMLAPKRVPKLPNPVMRWAGIGSLAAAALAIVGYMLLADVASLRDEVRQLQEEVAENKKVADKMQEKADETRIVQSWLSDSVDWLGQLKLLSDQFPDGQSASVSRLSAATLDDGGQLDLSVQVNDQELISGLESRLRSSGFAVTSKQVSEQSESDYPWRFEARIGFRNPPLDEREELEQFISLATDSKKSEDKQ